MFANENYIWDGLLKGNQTAFLSLYKTYYQSLFKYGFTITQDKELTKDTIQELFLELWNTRTTLNSGVLNIRSYLFTWLRRKISKHVALRSREKLLQENIGDANSEPSYEELLIALQTIEWKKEKLAKALDSLSKKQKQILKLKYFDNLSYKEIATRTAVRPRTVYNTIYEALKYLRQDVSLMA